MVEIGNERLQLASKMNQVKQKQYLGEIKKKIMWAGRTRVLL